MRWRISSTLASKALDHDGILYTHFEENNKKKTTQASFSRAQPETNEEEEEFAYINMHELEEEEQPHGIATQP